MKKVLALALAAIMVCTMAFAVSTGTENDYTDTTAADNTYMQSIVPGQSIVFTQEELNLTDANWGKTDGNFDPAKNTVKITVAVGSDLIASQGWVKTDATTYKYVVTTKPSETAVLDNNADIIISSIKVTIYGVSKPALDATYVKDVSGVTNYVYVASLSDLSTFEAKNPGENFCAMNAKAEDHILAMCFDYGRKADDTHCTFGKDGVVVTDMDVTGKTLYTVKAATVDGKYITSGNWYSGATENNGGKLSFSAALTAGDKVYFGTVYKNNLSATAQNNLTNNLNKAGAAIKASYGYDVSQTIINKSVNVSVDGMKEGYRAYMVKADGTVTDLSAKFESSTGLLSFTTTITGPIIVTDKALTATPTDNGGSGNGNTNNPETGANDVVGVAVALAIVAAASAAALSLKKD